MMLEDNGEVARVMMHDHAFSVPKDASGRAEVHGVLSVKEISKEAAEHLAEDGNGVVPPTRELRIDATGVRSEEHTSELQSLMRISYAVFCLKKKKKDKNNNQTAEYNKS